MPIQQDLFGDPPSSPPPAPKPKPPARKAPVAAAQADADLLALAQSLNERFGDRLFLGTSSWTFPGWRGLVWDERPYAQSELSRHGLAAYAAHPLFHTVSLDRTFYRAIDAATYASLARQVPERFKFVVKAPSEITDALIRMPDSGKPMAPNPHFLDPERALELAVRPARAGLGERFGALVFQLSPLPQGWLRDPGLLLDKLDALWRAVVPELPGGARAALELRDARMFTPELLRRLAAQGVHYCVGAHDRMPSAAEQITAMREAGPGDLICRWNLHRGLRYNEAKDQWAPFERLQAPDRETREALARAVVATLAQGMRAFVTINNKAEGCAPLSVIELARAILREAEAPKTNAP